MSKSSESLDGSVNDIVVIFCNECGYEEELHYNQFKRKVILNCPRCGTFLDPEECMEMLSYAPEKIGSPTELDLTKLTAKILG